MSSTTSTEESLLITKLELKARITQPSSAETPVDGKKVKARAISRRSGAKRRDLVIAFDCRTKKPLVRSSCYIGDAFRLPCGVLRGSLKASPTTAACAGTAG